MLPPKPRRFPPPWTVEELDAGFIVGAPAPAPLPKSPRKNGPVTLLGQPSAISSKGRCPMTLVLLTAFEISLALALGFVLGRIYQIRSDKLERRDGFALPPTARIPHP